MASLTRRELLELTVVAGGVIAAEQLVSEGAPPAAAQAAAAPPLIDVTLRVNGSEHQLSLDPRTTLLDALREHLRLTGSKKGCGLGQCGACTVLMDGKRVKSCLSLAALVGGREITTIEGLAQGDELHPLQTAFIERDAFQCGYCTSGQIMAGIACIHEGHAGSPQEIREWMSGNICRCGAYDNIVAAIQDAAFVTGSVKKG
jgi:xanthine dehydrogenase YagT iron-sulfur-binding subunit